MFLILISRIVFNSNYIPVNVKKKLPGIPCAIILRYMLFLKFIKIHSNLALNYSDNYFLKEV